MTINRRILDVLARDDRRCFLRLIFSDVDDPIELDYVSLIREATRWLEAYDATGVPKAGRVVIALPHSADLYAAFLGALISRRTPAILAPPSPKLSAEGFESMARSLLARLSCDLIVADDKLAGILAPLSDRPILRPSKAVFEAAPSGLHIDEDGDETEPAFIQYSSGTTGAKKGTVITHRAILAQVDAYARDIGLNAASDSIVSWLPIYHDMGLVACFLLPLLTGTPVTAMSPFEWISRPRMLMDAIGRHRPTLMWLPNFAYHVLARATAAAAGERWDLSSVRGIVNCSEPVRHASHAALANAWAPFGLRPEALKTCYAMAETTFAITSGGFRSPLLEVDVDPGSLGAGDVVRPGAHTLVSSGLPLAGTSVAVGTPEAPLPEGRVGEVWAQSPSMFGGYIADAEATAAALGRGWLRTGDIGFLGQGELFVLGRADDMIIVAGRNYHPQDIEAAADGIEGVIPGRSVAFAVDSADEGTSQLVVVCESETTEEVGRVALAGQIRQAITATLDAVPRDVRIVEPRWLRKSTSGKLSRSANRSAYLERFRTPDRASAAIPRVVQGESRLDRIRHIIAGLLGGRAVADTTPLLTSGLIDSLGLIQLCATLDQDFGRGIPSPNLVGFAQFDTVETIDRLIAEVQAGAFYGDAESAISTRLHKCRALERSGRDQDLLILGSSTAHFMRTRVAAEARHRAFNISVGSADPIDFYCLLRFAIERLSLPLRRIVVCSDSFLFKPRDGALVKARLLEVPDLLGYLMPEEREALPQSDAERSILRSHVQLSIRRMLEWHPGFRHSFDTKTGDIVDLERNLAEQDLPYPIVDETQRHADMLANFSGYDHLCPRRVAYYREMVVFAARHGIEVDHVVMPFHDALFRHVNERTTYPARMDDLLQMLAAVRRPGETIHDFRTVDRFGGDPADFTDPTHPGPVNLIALFRRVLARPS